MQYEESNEVADATENTSQENLSSDDLLDFISSEPIAEESTTEEVATEESGAETETEDENEVLSQTGDQTEDEVETEDEDQEETPKSVQKLLRQVGKLTARAKTAEENYHAISAEVTNLREAKSEEKAKSSTVNEVETFEELETLRHEAISAKKWARKHSDEEFVEENGQEFTRAQIKEIRDNAEDYLDEAIPARTKFLQEKHQSNQLALDTFNFLKEPTSAESELLQQINSNDRFKVLDTLPNGLYIKSLIVEGCKAVKNRGSVKKPTTTAKKPTPPSEPIGSEVSPPVRKVKNKNSILGKGNVSEDQLVAFLS